MKKVYQNRKGECDALPAMFERNVSFFGRLLSVRLLFFRGASASGRPEAAEASAASEGAGASPAAADGTTLAV